MYLRVSQHTVSVCNSIILHLENAMDHLVMQQRDERHYALTSVMDSW